MAKRAVTPPMNDQDMEDKLVLLALQQAEAQLKEGTASSQIITHFLKLASTRSQIELEKLELENRYLEEKIESEKTGQKMAASIQEVMNVLKSYSYRPPEADDVNIY